MVSSHFSTSWLVPAYKYDINSVGSLCVNTSGLFLFFLNLQQLSKLQALKFQSFKSQALKLERVLIQRLFLTFYPGPYPSGAPDDSGYRGAGH